VHREVEEQRVGAPIPAVDPEDGELIVLERAVGQPVREKMAVGVDLPRCCVVHKIREVVENSPVPEECIARVERFEDANADPRRFLGLEGGDYGLCNAPGKPFEDLRVKCVRGEVAEIRKPPESASCGVGVCGCEQ